MELILGRVLRVEPRDIGYLAASAEAQAQAVHATDVGSSRRLEERIVSLDEETAEAAEPLPDAADPDFIFLIATPPRVTVLTARLSVTFDLEKFDKHPYIIGTGPFCLLARFGYGSKIHGTDFSEYPKLPACYVMVRYFRSATIDHPIPAFPNLRGLRRTIEGLMAASAELVPDRPTSLSRSPPRYIESVGLFCNSDQQSYMIAELKLTTGPQQRASVIRYSSYDSTWSKRSYSLYLCPCPRKWKPHGATGTTRFAVWFDLSCGLVTCNLDDFDNWSFKLHFHWLPADRALNNECPKDIYTRRCMTMSEKLLRYVEIIPHVDSKQSATVSMWTASDLAVTEGWSCSWILNYEVNFNDIWKDPIYLQTNMPRNVIPVIAGVSPVNHNILYFSLEQHIFTVNMAEGKTMDCQRYELADVPKKQPRQAASSRYVTIWNLDT